MKKLFGRTPREDLAPVAVQADKDAHGCPACPHSGATADFDEAESSTLLPQGGFALDGRALLVAGSPALEADDLDGVADFEAD